MMNHRACFEALARHISDADIVLPVYSSAFEWLGVRPSPLNYTAHGAMGLASSHGLGLALGRPDRRVLRDFRRAAHKAMRRSRHGS